MVHDYTFVTNLTPPRSDNPSKTYVKNTFNSWQPL
jgi:hypothetical protein